VKHRTLYAARLLLAAGALLALSGCRSLEAPIGTVEHVDLERFMGDWYVLAAIPTWIEREAYNAVESYQLDADGRVLTTFTFNHGAADGPLRTYHPTGFVEPGTGNAVWGMQFVWPIRADYRVIHLDPEYQTTIIGRNQRDYAWIMARSPEIEDAAYRELLEILDREGYDTSEVRRVPHAPVAKTGNGQGDN
jgi:apolipoprotein D and lipocalin family protein